MFWCALGLLLLLLGLSSFSSFGGSLSPYRSLAAALGSAGVAADGGCALAHRNNEDLV